MGKPGARAAANLGLLMLVAADVAVDLLKPMPAVRGSVTVLALLLVPGSAIAIRLSGSEFLLAAALAVGLSLAIEIGVSLAMVWLHWWHPTVAGLALAGLTAVMLAEDTTRIVVRGARKTA